MIRKTNWRKGLAALMALVPITLIGGCNNGPQGALSGAALGSLAGLGIGSVTGDRSDAVTIGAILGGVGGAVIGDQNARASAYSTRSSPPPVTYSSEPIYVDRPVYVERQVYVHTPPTVVYKSWGGRGHYHHQRQYYRHHAPRHYGHRGYRGYYDPCR